MADYDPGWGARMQKKYGATEADLADPATRDYYNRRAQRDRAQPATPAPAPAPAQTPPVSTTESQPPQVDPNGPGAPQGPLSRLGGTCPDGKPPQQVQCFQAPCPPPRCSDGSTPGGGGQKPPPGGGYPGPGGGYPGPGYPGPGGGYPPAGYGNPYYGGPGTSQRAGFPGSPSYPTPGRPSPAGGFGPYGGGGYGGYGGGYGGWNQQMNYPNPQMAYDAMYRRG